MSIPIQCKTTKCGYHKNLKLGKWYFARYDKDLYGQYYYFIIDESGVENKYDKSLFFTVADRREIRLNKILK